MVFTRPGAVEMLEVDEPEAGEDEVLVEVRAAGICGSELHGISKPGFRQPPLVMGHEFAGTTPDGRRVTVNPIIDCGDCDRCRAGRTQVCRRRAIVGIHRAGAFAERVAVPARLVHELPDAVSFEVAAMVEPVANAVHAWRLAQAPQAARVAVLGAGTIGLVTLLVAKHHGAEVTVTDLADDRLAVAGRLGADRTGAALDGEYDVIVDAVGAADTHRASLEHLVPGGTTVWLGLLSTDPGFDAQDALRQEKTVRGSFAYTDDDFREALALASTLDLGWADTFALDAGAAIFTQLMEGRSDVVKALLRP